jgi:hypothetical protein
VRYQAAPRPELGVNAKHAYPPLQPFSEATWGQTR